MEYDRIFRTLIDNSDKSFVKRILQPDKYPTFDRGNGKSSIHSMAYSESDGSFFVYPTVVYDGESLQELSAEDAVSAAFQTGDMIMFDNEKDAAEFSKEYKKFWKYGQKPLQ